MFSKGPFPGSWRAALYTQIIGAIMLPVDQLYRTYDVTTSWFMMVLSALCYNHGNPMGFRENNSVTNLYTHQSVLIWNKKWIAFKLHCMVQCLLSTGAASQNSRSENRGMSVKLRTV
jgi:hypothetical protein